jgi:site-specific DNA-cytosine methylase/intein/homing endonuclease
MNVLSLFDGMSCGRIALKRAGIPVEKYFSSEVDKHAIKVANYHNPQDEEYRLGDVSHIDGTQLPKIDLLIGGSPCFVAGTKVITENAYKNIEDVQVGDEVLTHNNRFRKVIRVGGDSNKELYEVKAQGIKPTKVTGNHPYYVRTRYREHCSDTRRSVRKFTDPKWKSVDELTTDDFIGIPILNTSENPRNLTHEDCWLLGRYIADGHYRKDKRKGRKNSYQYQVIYSIGNTKLEEFGNNVKRPYSCYPHSQSVHRCVISSMELVNLIIDLGIGKGAINKTIPMELLNLPKDLLKRIVDGYISGDGHYEVKSDSYKASSISEELIMNLSIAIGKVYGTNTTYHINDRSGVTVIEGRTVNQKTEYICGFRTTMRKQSNAILIDDIIWQPIRSVEELDEKSYVYNMEVDGDNSYTANNAIVHNCTSFSFSGTRKGMVTKDDVEITTLDQYLELKDQGFEFKGQSYLFWEYMRLLNETTPKYFLLENVKMSNKWQDVLSNAIGCEPIVINSSLVSAQNRVRLYWTNIPNVDQPEDTSAKLLDILDNEDMINPSAIRGRRLNKATIVGRRLNDEGKREDSDTRIPITQCLEVRGKNQDKSNCLTTVAKDNVLTTMPIGRHPDAFKNELSFRYYTTPELCRLQTVPDNYFNDVTSNNQARKMLGNGWTVDVIAHIFKHIER